VVSFIVSFSFRGMEWRSERWNQGRGIDLLNGTKSPLNQAT